MLITDTIQKERKLLCEVGTPYTKMAVADYTIHTEFADKMLHTLARV